MLFLAFHLHFSQINLSEAQRLDWVFSWRMFTILHLLDHWAALFVHISYMLYNAFVNKRPPFPCLSLFCWQTVDKLAAKPNRILSCICLYLTLPSEVTCSCCEFYLIQIDTFMNNDVLFIEVKCLFLKRNFDLVPFYFQNASVVPSFLSIKYCHCVAQVCSLLFLTFFPLQSQSCGFLRGQDTA